MSKLISDSTLAVVVDNVVNAALEGDIKAASLIFTHFIPKPKSITANKGAYMSIDDIRNAYMIGIISAEDVIANVTALGILGDSKTTADISSWNPEMMEYLNLKK